MQTLTEKVFHLAPPGGIFDEAVVANLLPEHSPGARKLLVYRAVGRCEVLRLKPGLFCLAERYRKSHPHPFVVAAMLHSPSHVSGESALSYHGLIPEAVHSVSSVTVRRGRSFETPLGCFSFRRVPADEPRAGVRAVRLDDSGWAFVADPIRAIADLVYLRREVDWQRHGLAFLTKSLRIEEEDLQASMLGDVQGVQRSVRSKRVRTYLRGLREVLGQ